MARIDALYLTRIPSVSLSTMRLLKERHINMQRWQAIAKRAGKNSYEHEAWERRVDFFFDEIERLIFPIGRNPLDHGRKEAS